ncbi:hypothetical protein GCM10022228_19280 [Halomonas cibimaris]|uniref:Gamma-glutamylcyclotransferase AIG2-like domain-containing protein n=1 Tax=Halomonas cibimaris TaxID=657012 RepID=A0ABP7LUD0_9GAMM
MAYGIALVGTVLLALAVWWWFVWLSPWGYQRPADLAPVRPGSHQVFVYGTLRYAPVRYVVMGTAGRIDDATLPGFRRCGLNIAPAKNGRVAGQVFRASAAELSRLDRYERLGVRYTRRLITLADGTQAWVYRRLSPSGDGQTPMGCPGSDTISVDNDAHQGAR